MSKYLEVFMRKVHPKGANGFRWFVGVLDMRTNEQLFSGKNLDSKSFDSVVKELRKKFK